MPEKQKIALIFNPVAGTSRQNRLWIEKFKIKIQKKEEFDFQVFETGFSGHAKDLAKMVSENEFHRCLAMGGDGTMNEVAQGLLGSETALGLIPVGSGNGLARHLGYSMHPEKAFEQCIEAPFAKMDTGKCGQKYFFLAAGFGFEGVVAHAFSQQKGRGFFQYLLAGAKAWVAYKAQEYLVKIEDKSFEMEAFTFTIANGSQYGNNARIAPGASVCDGLLQWVCIRPFNFWESPRLFFQLMNGKILKSDKCRTDGARNVAVEFVKPQMGHLDGEPVWLENETQFEILPAVLKVVSPQKISQI
jgi:YegS/Rv2252/BmrU family lipid kinase